MQIGAALKSHNLTAGVKPLDLDDMAKASTASGRSPTDSLDAATLQLIQNQLTPRQKKTFQQFTKAGN